MSDKAFKYFSTFYDSIHFPVQIINEEGNIVYINPAFSFQWGYTLNELKEYSVFRDIELRKNGVRKIIQNAFNEKSNFTVSDYADSLLRAKEITIPIFSTNLYFLSFDNTNYVVLFHIDQTEMMITEEEIKKARLGNREAERLKNTFLNVLSHELRTPLNIILGYSSIIKENLKDKLGPEDKIYLDNLYSGSERLFRSITQMLDFAQLEAGNYKLNVQTVDLIGMLKSGITLIKGSTAKKNINLKTNFGRDKIYVDVDVQSVENIINNLLNNAEKFTKRGFIEIEADVLNERDLAICKIKDSGIGISTDYMDHLFKPFSQEDLNISRNFEGNGLGLALAKKYIEKLGGSLLVDSIKGVGTTFTFTLPLSQNISSNEEKIKSVDQKKKILMLDNTGESYELIKAFLKNTHLVKVYSLREFKIDNIVSDTYDAIIFDVNPNHWTQSLLICRDLKKNDPYNRSIIVLSSETIDSRIEEFYNAGADQFLVKPFSKSRLLKSLEETEKKTFQSLN
ncbi:MAG TPA: ATP-binding protein [Ignavibacteriaceae bacterium]|nr:ATP-binding protein [Ignavibacteriaceae bacterium]